MPETLGVPTTQVGSSSPGSSVCGIAELPRLNGGQAGVAGTALKTGGSSGTSAGVLAGVVAGIAAAIALGGAVREAA